MNTSIFKNPKVLIGGIIAIVLCLLVTCCMLVFVGSSDNGGGSKIGEFEFKNIEKESLVETKTWGKVPVDQVLIMFNDTVTKQKAEEIIIKNGGKVIGYFDLINLYQVSAKNKNKEELVNFMNKFKEFAEVEAISPNTPLVIEGEVQGKSCQVMDDMYNNDNNKRGYEMIGFEDAWKYIRASGLNLNDVHVGVVDDGLNVRNGDINGKGKIETLEGFDDENYITYYDKKGNITMGGYNHGTVVSNIIGANWENGGMVGVAGGLMNKLKVTVTDNLMFGGNSTNQVTTYDKEDPAQFIYSDGNAYVSTMLEDVMKQIKKGATVINISQGPVTLDDGNEETSKIYAKFLEKMNEKYPKVVFVASAGNSGGYVNGKNRGFGGGLKAPNLITVGALDPKGDTAWFSNKQTGDGEVTLATMGEDIPGVIGEDGKVAKVSGTSFATPQVSAAAAVLKSINPELSAEDVKRILVETASVEVSVLDDPYKSKRVSDEIGGKVLRLDKAVLKVINEKRADLKMDELTEEVLQKKSVVGLRATQREGSFDYNVFADIQEVGPDGVDVLVEMNGTGGFTGSETRHIDQAGVLNWDVNFFDETGSGVVTVTRLDTNSCSKIVLYATPEVTPTPIPTEIPQVVPTKKIEPPKNTVVPATKVPTKPTTVPTRKPDPPTQIPATKVPPTVAPPKAVSGQIISDCNLCWNGGLSCVCGRAACRCCSNDVDMSVCNAYDL